LEPELIGIGERYRNSVQGYSGPKSFGKEKDFVQKVPSELLASSKQKRCKLLPIAPHN
jgi:hypothetical protein